jgi:D-alanyl-lipoteichoic acid acyltransferase DltB (MBOAT superfamily)
MLFSTFDFLLFFVPVAALTWALRGWARVWLLLAASYFFYMAGPKTDPLPTPWYYAGLLLASTVLDYVCALRITAATARTVGAGDAVAHATARRARAAWLTVSLVGNLGLLAYFKYTNFLLSAAADVARAIGFELAVPHLQLLLPVGISFYTFQSLSYTIDVWRGRIPAERSFARFALYVVFFPQLVAGPIVRADEFLPQLRRPPQVDRAGLTEGMFRVIKGLTKKVIFGDYVAAQFTDAVFAAPGTYTSLEVLLALYAFTLQLYADFSGYSDIAIGVARILGYRLPENFDRPHQARNLAEFWRRWHMTLSTWLRDYLFFPLGGSRVSAGRAYFNLWLTMFLVGMWHGASWNFVIYSNLQAGAMLFNRWNRARPRGGGWANVAVVALAAVALGVAVAGLGRAVLLLPGDGAAGLGGFAALMFVVVAALPLHDARWLVVVQVALTFHFTVLSRIFFRAEDLDVSRAVVAKLVAFELRGVRPGLITPLVAGVLLAGLVIHFTPKRWVDELAFRGFARLPGPAIGLLFCGVCVAIMQLMAGAPRAFIYFQF